MPRKTGQRARGVSGSDKPASEVPHPDPLADPRVQHLVLDAFIQGTRVAKGHRISREFAAVLAPLIDEDGVAFDHSILEPPRKRGRPSRFLSMGGPGDPSFQKALDDTEIQFQYELILKVFRSHPVKRRKDEAFDGWVSRLQPVARMAWAEPVKKNETVGSRV